MKNKITVSRKKTYRKNKKSYKKRSNVMVNRMPSHSFIPPRYFTKLRLVYDGYIAVGKFGGYATVDMNTIYQPFNTVYPVSSVNMSLTGVGGSSSTNQYPGYSVLASMYTDYRIHASKITVIPSCVNNGDTFTLCVFAIPYNNISTITTATLANAAGQSNYKYRLVNPSSSMKDSAIKTTCKVREVLGYSKNQYMDNPAVKFAASQNASYDAQWGIIWNTNDGAITTGQVFLSIELECYAEFCNPINPLN